MTHQPFQAMRGITRALLFEKIFLFPKIAYFVACPAFLQNLPIYIVRVRAHAVNRLEKNSKKSEFSP